MDKTEAIELLKDILRINTTNPPGNEALAVKRLLPVFKKAGIETEIVDYSEGRQQLIATYAGEERGKTLAFTGHLDVVPVGEIPWTYDPFGAKEVGGKIYGRGAGDMKSGLVAMVAAIVELKEADTLLKGTLKFMATVGEETSSIGARQLLNEGYADDLDAVLIGEPTGNEIAIAEKGCLWLRITTYGQTGHGSTPSHGVNANEHMIAILSKFRSGFTFDFEPDDMLREPTSSIDVLHGGSGTNVIPDKCTVEIDMRTLPSQNHKDIIKKINKLIDTVKEGVPDLNAKIEVINDMKPVKTPGNNDFVMKLIDAVSTVRRKRIVPYGFSGYTDGAYFSQSKKSFPIAITGPGYPPISHQPNEYIEKDAFFDAIEIYKKIAVSFLG